MTRRTILLVRRGMRIYFAMSHCVFSIALLLCDDNHEIET